MKDCSRKARKSAPKVGHQRPWTRRKERRSAVVPVCPSAISTGKATDQATPSQTAGRIRAMPARTRPPNMRNPSQISDPIRPVAARSDSRQSGVPPR